jgi:hypothetical protein
MPSLFGEMQSIERTSLLKPDIGIAGTPPYVAGRSSPSWS